MKEVRIEWYDIYFLHEALSLKDLKDARPALQVTYGQLLVEEKDYVTVVSTVDLEKEGGEEFYRNAVSIPRGCIKEIKEL